MRCSASRETLVANNTRVRRLGDILVSEGVISPETLRSALNEQKVSHMRLGEILINNGWITENNLAAALCRQLELKQVSLASVRPQQEALDAVPENVAFRLKVIPLELIGTDKIEVAAADPLNVSAADELALLTNRSVEMKVAAASDIDKALVSYYRVQSSVQDAMEDVIKQDYGGTFPDAVTVFQTKAQDVADIGADAAPVVRLVNSILEQGVRERASDIHIEPAENITRVRFRIDGTLFPGADIPSNLHLPLTARIKIIAGMDIAEKRRPQDGRILIQAGKSRIDLRVSTLPSILGEKVVLRLLDRSAEMPGIQNLGFSAAHERMLTEAVFLPNGIVLVTGPTGSGKSTTLYSLLDIINSPGKNILTIEDPVEYTVAGLTQIQVNEKIGLTFGSVLRSMLRQDPDIVMVGEMRDTETARLAVRAALTGHLVLSTLHTNDAPSSVNRLIDMGVPRYLLASSLRMVLAQRLVKTLCPHCRKKITVTSSMEHETGIEAGTPVYAPGGCPECRFTGYRGRTVIAEIMPVDHNVRSMISNEAAERELRDYSRLAGMSTMREDARRKVEEGITSIEEMLMLTMTD